MSRRKRALRQGMAEAWAAFAERSEPGYQPDSQGDAHAQGDAQLVGAERPVGAEASSVSVETPGGADASAI